MPNWNDPSNSQPDHVNVLKNLADKDTYAVTMGQNTAGYTDLPNGTMNIDNAQKLLRRLEAGSFEVFTLSLAGGGTGANTPAGVRSNINVSEAGVGASQVRTNSQNDLRYPLKANALSDMNAGDVRSNINVLEAGTSGSQVRTNTQNDARFLQSVPTATETEAGVVEKATSGEMSAGMANKFPDAATIKGYYGEYKEETLNAPSGDFTSGACKIVKTGSAVTVSGSFSHASAQGANSALGFIPSWGRPIQTQHNTTYSNNLGSGEQYRISITQNGQLFFEYFNGNLGNLSGTGASFNISYTI